MECPFEHAHSHGRITRCAHYENRYVVEAVIERGQRAVLALREVQADGPPRAIHGVLTRLDSAELYWTSLNRRLVEGDSVADPTESVFQRAYGEWLRVRRSNEETLV